MVRALPSAIPQKMYRHFALVTVLLTAGIAMFADGENREAIATQIEERGEQQELRQASAEKVAKPTIVRRNTSRRHRFVQHKDGFDESFGAPMERPVGSGGTYTTEVATEAAQAGYSDEYLASLSPQERDLLLKGLEKEGLLSPEERERRSASLTAASHIRSGGSFANH